MNIVIRTDASIDIGTGHVMRCLTLAKQLKRHGAEVTFICREGKGNLLSYLHNEGMDVISLPSIERKKHDIQWMQLNWKRDVEETKRVLDKIGYKVDLLIVDHYGIDYQWEKQLRSAAKFLMVIDDLADRRHDCDLLLDQNYYRNLSKRYKGLVPTHCKQLLGPDYVLLREEFLEAAHIPRKRIGEIKNVFVFFGGTDPSGETVKVLQALKELSFTDVMVNVIVGESNPRRREIEERCYKIPNVVFHCQVNNIAELMRQADIAIGAGGATTWERCFLGLPTITVAIAPNQLEATKLLHDEQVIVYIGESETVSSDKIKEAFLLLLHNPPYVKTLAGNSMKVVNQQKVKEQMVAKTIQQVVGGSA